MTRLRLFLTQFLLLLVVAAFAATFDKAEYYKNAKGKKGEALKTALAGIIYTKNSVGYDGLKAAYKTTDVRDDDYLYDVYSNTTNYIPGSAYASSYKVEGDGYNREHTIPQSLFNGASPMYADLYHVYPTDAKMNGERGNFCHGEVNTSAAYSGSKNNFSKWGAPSKELKNNGCEEGKVFEPNDIYKGDFARTYFYFVTCYQSKMTSLGDYGMFNKTTYPSFTTWALTMLLKWAKDDPVSTKETLRITAVYNTTQHNRNPFIDFPGLEQYIWGDYQNVAFDPSNYRNPYGETPDPEPDPNPDPDPIPAGDQYVKVTEQPTDWAGTYLIVYEDAASSKALNGGGLSNAQGNYIAVSVTDNQIAVSSATEAAEFAVKSKSNGYSIQGKDGNYIGHTSGNALNFSENDDFVNTLSYSSEGTVIGCNGYVLRFNSSADMFRFYKSGLQPVQLYRKITTTVLLGDVNNDGQVTIADVTALVNIILGKDNTTPYQYDHDAADTNKDGQVTIADVTALVNIILEK